MSQEDKRKGDAYSLGLIGSGAGLFGASRGGKAMAKYGSQKMKINDTNEGRRKFKTQKAYFKSNIRAGRIAQTGRKLSSLGNLGLGLTAVGGATLAANQFNRPKNGVSKSLVARPVPNQSKLSQRLVGHGANASKPGSASRIIGKSAFSKSAVDIQAEKKRAKSERLKSSGSAAGAVGLGLTGMAASYAPGVSYVGPQVLAMASRKAKTQAGRNRYLKAAQKTAKVGTFFAKNPRRAEAAAGVGLGLGMASAGATVNTLNHRRKGDIANAKIELKRNNIVKSSVRQLNAHNEKEAKRNDIGSLASFGVGTAGVGGVVGGYKAMRNAQSEFKNMVNAEEAARKNVSNSKTVAVRTPGAGPRPDFEGAQEAKRAKAYKLMRKARIGNRVALGSGALAATGLTAASVFERKAQNHKRALTARREVLSNPRKHGVERVK